MRPVRCGVLLFAFFLTVLHCAASYGQLSLIQPSALPQEKDVLAALEDAEQMEPFSASWTSDWHFDRPKSEVAEHLAKDVAVLVSASKIYPENGELQLLTGLVGRNAYNVDVKDSYDATMSALGAAIALAPKDLRGPWNRAAFVCSTDKPGPGGAEYLALEASHSWDELPVEFWEDYTQCMHIVDMPAHVLRALKHLKDLHDANEHLIGFFTEAEGKRLETVDKTRNYKGEETWSSRPQGGNVVYTNTGCGIAIEARPSWTATGFWLAKGDCSVNIKFGPYEKKKDKASVLIFTEAERPGQGMSEFQGRYLPTGYGYEPFSLKGCPVEKCVVYHDVPTDAKTRKSKDQAYSIFFERDEPEFPGLALEVPEPPQVDDGQAGPQYFRPEQRMKRVPGKIYYEVTVVFQPGMEAEVFADLEFLLDNIKVD
jgi:hypothetical protein